MAGSQERAAAKTRLDRLLVARRFFPSREKAAFSIRIGGVQVNGRTVTKPAAQVDPDAQISVDAKGALRIGRGERKLAGVLERFGVDCTGKVALDVGSGAGGFTWLLLRHGVRRVFAVDVGSDQLSGKLRSDPRVAVYEKTDVRDLTSLPDPPHIALVDVSFISLRAVLPHVCTLTRADADLVVLLKPQFEIGSVAVQKGETVRRAHTQGRIRDAFIAWCSAHNLTVRGTVESPLPGKHGDRELFLHLKPM